MVQDHSCQVLGDNFVLNAKEVNKLLGSSVIRVRVGDIRASRTSRCL